VSAAVSPVWDAVSAVSAAVSALSPVPVSAALSPGSALSAGVPVSAAPLSVGVAVPQARRSRVSIGRR